MRPNPVTAEQETMIRKLRAEGMSYDRISKQMGGLCATSVRRRCVDVECERFISERGVRSLGSLMAPLKGPERTFAAVDRGTEWRIEPRALRHACRVRELTIFNIIAHTPRLSLTEVYRSIESAGLVVNGSHCFVIDPARVEDEK